MADRRLQVFHAVAKHLSFTRAAEALFMTQPAVTFQIRQLEDQVRTKLFDRRHGSISLTPAGELVLSYAERILALSDELDTRLGEMTDEMRGALLVGASSSIGEGLLPRILSEFNALYPQVRLSLQVGNSREIEAQVAAQAIDLGLIEAESTREGLKCQPCARDELVMICAPDHPLAAVERILARELADYEYISPDAGSGTRAIAEAYFLAHKIPPGSLKIQMELGSPEALKGVVRTGLGFGIISCALVESEAQRESLVVRSLEPPIHRDFYLISIEDRFQTRVMRTFIDFTIGKLREFAI